MLPKGYFIYECISMKLIISFLILHTDIFRLVWCTNEWIWYSMLSNHLLFVQGVTFWICRPTYYWLESICWFSFILCENCPPYNSHSVWCLQIMVSDNTLQLHFIEIPNWKHYSCCGCCQLSQIRTQMKLN